MSDPVERVTRRRALRRPSGRAMHIAAYGLAALASLVAVLLFVLPAQRAPEHSDVVYVLGAPQPWQVRWAEALVSEHRADAVLISVPSDVEPPSTCTERPGTICLTPRSDTTAGEAEQLRDAMRQHGWRSATVLTTTPHVFRTRIVVGRCVQGPVAVLGGSDSLDLAGWIGSCLYEAAASVKALFADSC